MFLLECFVRKNESMRFANFNLQYPFMNRGGIFLTGNISFYKQGKLLFKCAIIIFGFS